MDESLDINEQIINYLDGLMGPVEKADFENRLRQNPAWQQQLNDLRVAIEAARQFGAREKVASLHREMMKELKAEEPEGRVVNFKKVVRYSLAVAASILLVLIGVQTFKYFSNTPGKLYNEAFVDYSLSSERGIKDSASAIENDYKSQDYKQVIRNANHARLSQKDSFLVALSFLKANNPSSAIRWFNQINTSSRYHQDAEFYLSLAYLKNRNYKEALDLMTKIHDDRDHPYHENVSEALIKSIRKML